MTIQKFSAQFDRLQIFFFKSLAIISIDLDVSCLPSGAVLVLPDDAPCREQRRFRCPRYCSGILHRTRRVLIVQQRLHDRENLDTVRIGLFLTYYRIFQRTSNYIFLCLEIPLLIEVLHQLGLLFLYNGHVDSHLLEINQFSINL